MCKLDFLKTWKEMGPKTFLEHKARDFEPVTVLVCGGRDFEGYEIAERVLNGIPIGKILHGGATGADAIASMYATEKSIPEIVFPADWTTHGKSAGPRRNQQMIDFNPDIVVAFPGGKGTKDLLTKAEKAKIPCFIVHCAKEEDITDLLKNAPHVDGDIVDKFHNES